MGVITPKEGQGGSVISSPGSPAPITHSSGQEKNLLLSVSLRGPKGEPGPSGGVSTVNNLTGNVVLGAEEVGADPAGSAASTLASHLSDPDPHSQYLVLADAVGTAAGVVATHEAAANPHPQYERNLIAGTNVDIDRTDPANPVISAVGGGGTMTPAEIKTAYESNPNTNAFTDANVTKLAGIAAGATPNSADATLLARSNHTGTQAASTISDLTEVTQDVVGAMIVAGTNVSVSYDDVAGTLTISATGGGSGGSGINPEPLPAAEALAAGNYVNLYLDAGTVKARKAGGSGKYPAHGFVKAAFSVAATASVYPLSMTNDALASLTAGTTYFLSTSTAGAVQATAPNSSGVLRQELGVAISATDILHTNSIPVELI